MEQVFNYKTLSIHIVTTTGFLFLLAMTKSRYAALVQIYSSGGNPFSHNCDYGVIRKTLPM
jgi:hypothetical protein